MKLEDCQFTIKHYVLWSWDVVNSDGKTLFSGTKEQCEIQCAYINKTIELAYEIGRTDAVKEFKEIITTTYRK